MDASWLSGIAVLISALVGIAAYLSGRRQDRRSTGLEEDRIRSGANDSLIRNLQADNDDLREELALLRERLERALADCRDCTKRLDDISREMYGRYRRNE